MSSNFYTNSYFEKNEEEQILKVKDNAKIDEILGLLKEMLKEVKLIANKVEQNGEANS